MSENLEDLNATGGSDEMTPLISCRRAIRGTALTVTAGLLGGVGFDMRPNRLSLLLKLGNGLLSRLKSRLRIETPIE